MPCSEKQTTGKQWLAQMSGLCPHADSQVRMLVTPCHNGSRFRRRSGTHLLFLKRKSCAEMRSKSIPSSLNEHGQDAHATTVTHQKTTRKPMREGLYSLQLLHSGDNMYLTCPRSIALAIISQTLPQPGTKQSSARSLKASSQ